MKTSLTEPDIIAGLSRNFFRRRYACVVDHCQWTGHECDLLVVTRDLKIIDVEIKVSRSDFRADKKKDKWWQGLGGGKIPVDLPRKVWKHYFVMPHEIFSEDLVEDLPSPKCGILLAHKRGAMPYPDFTVKRGARGCSQAYRLSGEEVIDVARLATLRLWQ